MEHEEPLLRILSVLEVGEINSKMSFEILLGDMDWSGGYKGYEGGDNDDLFHIQNGL